MGFFGFGKKKNKDNDDTKKQSFEIPSMAKPQEDANLQEGVLVLGMGCDKCKKLTEISKEALQKMESDLEVKHITDLSTIAAFGITATPALVIDGQVVSSGKVLKTEEVMSLIKQIHG